MRTALVSILFVMGCAGTDDDDGDGGGSGQGLSCPEEAEVCVVWDNGWDVACRNGVVEVDDLTATGYCAAGSTEVLCETGGRGSPTVQHTCPGACATDEVKWFETHAEYSAFDPASLCL
jgi:hypothetical protein